MVCWEFFFLFFYFLATCAISVFPLFHDLLEITGNAWINLDYSCFCYCWLQSKIQARHRVGGLNHMQCCLSSFFLQDHPKLAYQHWFFFSTAHYAASSPVGVTPSTTPHVLILSRCLFMKIPIENVPSPLLITESRYTNSWSPHLSPIFSLTSLWSHIDCSIKQFSLPSLNFCYFSYSQCQ